MFDSSYLDRKAKRRWITLHTIIFILFSGISGAAITKLISVGETVSHSTTIIGFGATSYISILAFTLPLTLIYLYRVIFWLVGWLINKDK